MLRGKESFEDLRSMLRRRRVEPRSALLAALAEDADGNEFGVIVTPDRRVYEYKRRVRLWKTRPRLLVWQERTGDIGFEKECPHVVVALELLDPPIGPN